jgi:fluoroacetyl-CoA thioesterase
MISRDAAAAARIVVQPWDTARHIAISPGDVFPEVFATVRMIGLMEVAAARLLQPHCAEGEMSVGVGVTIRHTAPTPVGSMVRAVATYLGQEGKLFRFRVEAYDDGGLIGEGEHTRAIVMVDRLMKGAKARHEAAA